MEFYNDLDNFEQLLREKTEQFKMYPTKRVWFSIYNNIHPGRKWPSVAIGMMMIALLLMIGYFNNDNSNANLAAQHRSSASTNLAVASPSSASESSTTTSQPSLHNTISSSSVEARANNSNQVVSAGNNQFNFTPSAAVSVANSSINPSPKNGASNWQRNGNRRRTMGGRSRSTVENSVAVAAVEQTLPLSDGSDLADNAVNTNISSKATDSNDASNLDNDKKVVEKNASDVTLVNNDLTTPEIGVTQIVFGRKRQADNKLEEVQKNTLGLGDRAWIEHYAAYNRPAPKKWAGKLGWQVYLTPSVVFSELTSHATSDASGNSINSDINVAVVQKPAMGLETGFGLQYRLFKGVTVKTGLQLNYTRYNNEAYLNDHPNMTSITLSDGNGRNYQAVRSSPYSNTVGFTTSQLHNETFQISIPIGLDLRIAGRDNIEWKIGGTIQPSYILGATAYLISSDRKSYIPETSFIKNLNLNATIETFISIKSGNGYTWQFGPQFRKQLLSTNSNQYTVEERLNNYGLKIGVSKTF